VCWSLAGIGALNFPPDEHQGIIYFCFTFLYNKRGKKKGDKIFTNHIFPHQNLKVLPKTL